MSYYKIINITDKNGQTRTDGLYPNRIGCTIWVEYEPEVGSRYVMAYTRDNQGNPKNGTVYTSTILNWNESWFGLIIETLNSIYYLQKTD